jgi:hypothetical protein
MSLPVSFSEVSYYDDEYRGDLIITERVIYFFPRKRSGYDKIYLFGGVFDRVLNWLFKSVLMLVSGVGIMDIIEHLALALRFVKRSSKSKNIPKIAENVLWREGQTGAELQRRLDNYLLRVKAEDLDFSKDSLPKPFAFRLSEMENISFKWKFEFTAKFDTHDFGVSPFQRKEMRAALKEGGFLD